MKRPTPIDEEYIFDKGLMISAINLRARVMHGNKKFYEVSGYSKEGLLGYNYYAFLHPDMPRAVFNQVRAALKAGKEWNGIVKVLRKDGRYYWAYSHITPLFSEGKVYRFSIVKRPASTAEIKESKLLYTKLLKQEKGII